MLPKLSIDFCRRAWKQLEDCAIVAFHFEPDKVFVLDYDGDRKEYTVNLLRYYKNGMQMFCSTLAEYVKNAKDIYNFCAEYTADDLIQKTIIN